MLKGFAAGIGLLIAYSVAFALGGRMLADRDSRGSHEFWLGLVTGLGVCALIGIGLSFGLAEHRRVGHDNLVDWLGLWWAIGSIGFLGIMVALQPLSDHEWRKAPQRHRWRSERLRSGRSPSRAPEA
jgi:hypothetical protein